MATPQRQRQQSFLTNTKTSSVRGVTAGWLHLVGAHAIAAAAGTPLQADLCMRGHGPALSQLPHHRLNLQSKLKAHGVLVIPGGGRQGVERWWG